MSGVLLRFQAIVSAILDIATQVLGALFSLAFLPFAAGERALHWLFAQSRLTAISLYYYRAHTHTTQEARSSARFLRTYLHEYSRLVAEFRGGHYQNPQQAQAAYSLFKLAEADLMARARAEIHMEGINPSTLDLQSDLAIATKTFGQR